METQMVYRILFLFFFLLYYLRECSLLHQQLEDIGIHVMVSVLSNRMMVWLATLLLVIQILVSLPVRRENVPTHPAYSTWVICYVVVTP